jgi:hypothetical protein
MNTWLASTFWLLLVMQMAGILTTHFYISAQSKKFILSPHKTFLNAFFNNLCEGNTDRAYFLQNSI